MTAGAVLAVAALACYPVAVLFSAAFPGLLVPQRTRARHRARRAARHERRHPGKPASRPASAAPLWLRNVVLFADRRRCVARHLGGCAGRPDGKWFYEVDHAVPYAGGGLPTIFNLFSLCFFHNQTKCNYSVDRDGYVHYRRSSYGGVHDVDLAAKILAAELRARRNPLRYARAALAVFLAG